MTRLNPFAPSPAAKRLGTCAACGNAIYENLVHQCGTSVDSSWRDERWTRLSGCVPRNSNRTGGIRDH